MRIIAVVFFLILSGCASAPKEYVITYNSYPTGAVIIENGKVWGRSPFSLRYNNFNTSNYLAESMSVTCKWPSGATVETGKIRANLHEGAYFTVSCVRPADFPNLETDLALNDRITAEQRALAIQNARNELQRRQTDAVEGIFVIQAMEHLGL